jgi:hypothetical protein
MFDDLTWQRVLERVEDGDDDVDEDGAHEDDVAPEGHEAGHPEQGRVAPQLLLPPHLGKHVVRALKKVGHFRTLFLSQLQCEKILLNCFLFRQE